MKEERVQKRYCVINMRTGDTIWCDEENTAKMHLARIKKNTEKWLKEMVDDDEVETLRNYFLANKLMPRSHDFEIHDFYDPEKRRFLDGVPMKVVEGIMQLARDDSSYLDGTMIDAIDVQSFDDGYDRRLDVVAWLFQKGGLSWRERIAIERYNGDIRLVTDSYAKYVISIEDDDTYHLDASSVPDRVIDEKSIC